jgi:hypothetical protein
VSTYQTLYLHPPVYPFIPPPSICPESRSAGLKEHNGESSIRGNHPAITQEVSSTTDTPTTLTAMMTRSDFPATSSPPLHNGIEDCSAKCTKMYAHTFQCSRSDRRQTLHGQIWQGGADESGNLRRWRRNQRVAKG